MEESGEGREKDRGCRQGKENATESRSLLSNMQGSAYKMQVLPSALPSVLTLSSHRLLHADIPLLPTSTIAPPHPAPLLLVTEPISGFSQRSLLKHKSISSLPLHSVTFASS